MTTPTPPAELTQFDYLLNAMEAAGHATNPHKNGYGEKRKALFAYVRELEAARLAVPEVQPIRMLDRAQVHSALPYPGERGEFIGGLSVQMTWDTFNEWAANLQRKFCSVNGLTIKEDKHG